MIGRLLITAGLMLVVVGLLVMLGQRIPGFRLFRLPGDLYIERGNSTFMFPITSMLLISAVGSLLFQILRVVKR